MPPTERLYYSDSHLVEFEARVTDKSERVSGWTAVTLDRTAFYPTGGGQPSDTGTLNGARVLECIDAEDDGVLHVITATNQSQKYVLETQHQDLLALREPRAGKQVTRYIKNH